MRALVITTKRDVLEREGAITLSFLNQGVGGYLEAVSLRLVREVGPALVATMYVNEEGKLKRLPVNPIGTVLARLAGGLHDTIVGDVVLVGPPDKHGEDTSLAGEWVELIGSLAQHKEDRE